MQDGRTGVVEAAPGGQPSRADRFGVSPALLRWLAPAILVVGLAGALLAIGGWLQETGAKTDEAGIIARGAAQDINRFLTSQLATVESIAASDAVVDEDVDAMNALFDRIDPASIGFDGQLFWIDRHMVMRARSNYDGPPVDFSDREWVQFVRRTDQPYVSNARLGQLNNAPIIVFAVPTHDRNLGHTGVLGAAMRLSDDQQAAFSLRTAGGSAVTIIDRVGQLIAGPEPITTLRTVDASFPYEALRAEGGGTLSGVAGPTGEPDRLIGYAAVPVGDWLLLVDRAQGQAFDAARDQLLIQLGLILGSTALAVAVAAWSSRRVERSLAAQRASAAQLETLVEELREREELREAFVGVMSHELRTPATTIYGMAAILARSPDREDRDTIIEDIRDEADRLDRIIEDLLVLSRAERKVLAVSPEPVLVQRVVPSVVAAQERRYRGVPLDITVGASLPPVVAEDGALRQVLGNLLANAAKYGGGGPVRLTATSEPGGVRIEIADRGPGIPPADLDRLFDLYYRSPRTAKVASGTGIGLFVVRQLIEAMGGTVTATNAPEGGAVFTVTLRAYTGEE